MALLVLYSLKQMLVSRFPKFPQILHRDKGLIYSVMSRSIFLPKRATLYIKFTKEHIIALSTKEQLGND